MQNQPWLSLSACFYALAIPIRTWTHVCSYTSIYICVYIYIYIYIWSFPVILKLNWGTSPLIFCRIRVCYSVSSATFCTCYRINEICLWYLCCLFNWPQAIGIFIFVSWKVKLIGDMKWNPIRSDNFRGFQWNVVNEQAKSKHRGELIKLSGEHHKYSKFGICGIVYVIIVLLW